MTDMNRAGFFRLGAKGGLLLVAGGTVLAASSVPAFAQAEGDVAIASLAATAELLALETYDRAIKTGKFKADQLAYLQAAMQNEQDHYDSLAGLLGDMTPKGIKFKFPPGAFATPKSIADLGVALETAFVGAYMGAVSALEDNMLKGIAAQVGANEAQHLTVFNQLAAGGTLVPNPSLPEELTAEEATMAVTPFLA